MRAGGPVVLFALLLACSGCRNPCELVESELRVRDTQLREAIESVGRLEARNDALAREIAALRGGQHLPPEAAAPTFGLKRIVLGRGSHGYDNDGLPGDEALQVVVEPHDCDGHTVKVPASLHLSVVEISPQGLKKPLCWWEFGPEQLRTSWKQGLLSTGYTLLLPWTAFPSTETVRVVAQLKLLDGRLFEADKDLKVRLVPGAPRVVEPAPLGPNLGTPPLLPAPTPLPPPMPPPGEAAAGPLWKLSSSNSSPAAVDSVRWAPAPLTGAATLGRPQPLLGGRPAAP